MPEEKKMDRFLCPSCSADMEFDPPSGELKCRYCAHLEAVPVSQGAQMKPHALVETLAKTDASHLQTFSGESLQVSCSGCGSVVVFQPPEVAGTCPFCAASIVAQPKVADPLIAPDGVLPAKVPKDKARAEVQQWLSTRWFAPNALKKMAQQEGIGGVYLPFWDYAADTASRYQGQRGEHYYETEEYEESDGQGGRVRRTRQVQRTRWNSASGQVSRSFDSVLIPATRSVAESRLDALQPWDLEALCPYEPAYLAGFKAQRYQLELSDGFEEAKGEMKGTIEQDVRSDIGGDEQIITAINTDYSNETFLHLLLPVWIGAYRFQGKVFQVAVNARTGEVQGERPYSALKIALLVMAIVLVLIIIAVLRK
jgi:ribosomal protein S27E